MDVSKNPFGEDGKRALALALAHGTLTCVSLDLGGFGQTVKLQAPESKESPHARLRVIFCLLPEDLILLAAWITSPATKFLTSLGLRGASIKCEGCSVLAKALLASNIRTLDISRNQIQDKGKLALAASVAHGTLTRVRSPGASLVSRLRLMPGAGVDVRVGVSLIEGCLCLGPDMLSRVLLRFEVRFGREQVCLDLGDGALQLNAADHTLSLAPRRRASMPRASYLPHHCA